MNDQLKERILRALEPLSDERGFQLLDYVEFLESKYAERANPSNVFTKMTDKAQDLMRAGKLPLDAISGTVGFFDGASKVMKGLANAGTRQWSMKRRSKRRRVGTAPTTAAPTPAAPSPAAPIRPPRTQRRGMPRRPRPTRITPAERLDRATDPGGGSDAVASCASGADARLDGS